MNFHDLKLDAVSKNTPEAFTATEEVFPLLVLTFDQIPCLLFGFWVHRNRNGMSGISDPCPELLGLVPWQVNRVQLRSFCLWCQILGLLMAHFICHQAAHSSGLAESLGNS